MWWGSWNFIVVQVKFNKFLHSNDFLKLSVRVIKNSYSTNYILKQENNFQKDSTDIWHRTRLKSLSAFKMTRKIDMTDNNYISWQILANWLSCNFNVNCRQLAHDLYKTHMTRAVSDYDSQLKKMVPRAAATTTGMK